MSSEWPSLGADGSITGRFVDRRTAEELGAAVEKYRANSKSDHSKYIERWVGQSVPGASTTRIEVADRNGEFVLEAKFASPRFAQRPQAQMMIFKAGLLSHGDLRLAEKKRKHPVVVETDVLRETVRIQLPAGFKVDELPTAVRIDSEFGKYEATWAAEDGAGGAICGTQAVPRSRCRIGRVADRAREVRGRFFLRRGLDVDEDAGYPVEGLWVRDLVTSGSPTG